MGKIMRGLAESQIAQIHDATEDILDTVGFRVMHKQLRSRCRAAGARVDETAEKVYLPAAMLRELVAQVPSSFTIADLAGNQRVIGGQGSASYTAIVTDPWIIDYATQQPRRPALNDIRRHTIVAQKLDQVGSIKLMDFPVADVPGPVSNLRAMEEHLLLHNKHISTSPNSLDSHRRWLSIGDILKQGRDHGNDHLMSVAVAVISPMTLSEMNGDILMSACANGLNMNATSCPMAGTTSPYSLAGTLLLGNVEQVFMGALTQIVQPGTCFLYGIGPSVSDMRTGDPYYYSVNTILWDIAAAQLAHSYGLPLSGNCGGAMGYQYDLQTGAEGILFMLAAHWGKGDWLGSIGSGYNALGMSGELMIIHTVWQDVVDYLSRAINTEGRRLGVESIKRVGPGGNFLTDELTLELLRSEEFFSHDLMACSAGSGEPSSLLERAHAKLEEMVTEFESPLPETVQQDLRQFFQVEYAKFA